GTITNEVAISHGSLTFPDDPDQNVSGETDTQVLVEPVPQLLVAKMANPSAIPDAAGEPVEFMLIVRAYDAPVNSVNVSDTLPPNWAYVAGSTIITLPGGGTVSGPPAEPAVAGQTLGWNLGLSLVPGEELIIRFTAVTTAAPGGDSVNEAS